MMHLTMNYNSEGQQGRKRQLGAPPDAKIAKMARRTPSGTSEPSGNSSDSECSDIADGVERIPSGVPVHPAGAGFAAQELGHVSGSRSDNAESSAICNAGHERLAPGRYSGEHGHASPSTVLPNVAKGRGEPLPTYGTDIAHECGGALSIAADGIPAGCGQASSSCASKSGTQPGAALVGFGQDVLKIEFLRLCKEEESVKAALKQVRLDYAARRAVAVRSSVSSASAAASAPRAPVQLPTCFPAPTIKPSEPIRSSGEQQLVEQQRLRQLMPPPATPAQQLAAYWPPAGPGGWHAPRTLGGSAPRPLPPQQQLVPALRYGGVSTPYGVASLGQQHGLAPRMQAGPAAATVHGPHGTARLQPRHTAPHISREQLMQLQLLSAAAGRQQAVVRGGVGATR